MLLTLERPAVLRDVRDVQPKRKLWPMIVTPESPVVSMDMMDVQPPRNVGDTPPRRKLSGILVLLSVFVRVTFPEGQGDHLLVVVS